jgi:DNA-binding transcriptional regulator YiaG
MKPPKLYLSSGQDAKSLRQKLGLNQSQFWNRVSVTQSGGSRYESGRALPAPVAFLLHLAYAPEKQMQALLTSLRLGKDA